MRICFRTFLAATAVVAATLAGAQTASPSTDADPWSPVKFMVGKWQGTSTGQPGEGKVMREYEFVLRNRFLHERNTSTYPPSEKKPNGEVHEHVSYISHDRARKTLVFRQFHVEGFVNQYALNREASTEKRLVFESESFENLSNKWKARETYEIIGPDEFVEIFELAMPDKPFQVYSRNHFKRVK